LIVVQCIVQSQGQSLKQVIRRLVGLSGFGFAHAAVEVGLGQSGIELDRPIEVAPRKRGVLGEPIDSAEIGARFCQRRFPFEGIGEVTDGLSVVLLVEGLFSEGETLFNRKCRGCLAGRGDRLQEECPNHRQGQQEGDHPQAGKAELGRDLAEASLPAAQEGEGFLAHRDSL